MAGRPGPDPGDPAGALLALMARLEPALAPEAVLAALSKAAARPDGRCRIAAAVTGQPGLLTGQGARAPIPGILRFISALAGAGATAVAEPPCPRCGRQRQLGNPVEGLRVCGGCRSKARALRCGRCGKVRSIARRNDGGKPLCQNCWHRDPRSWKPCAECGSKRRVAAVTKAGPVCQSCRPGPDLPCSICQSGDGGRIGISRATGTPVCERCRKRWITCSRCGTGAPLKGGTLHEPLCARCLNPDPAFWKRCASCQQTWQLSTAECTRCCLDRRLKQALAPPDGTTAPELDKLRRALVRVDRPDLMLDWLKRPAARGTLQAVAASGAVTHEALDSLPPGRGLAHVRSMLVAAGALPARDERLTALESWVSQVIAGQADPGHRQALRGYALWHHLRRLRGRLDGRPTSRDQVKNVHDQVTAAAAFLDWLTARGLTLASCTQAELDQWLAGTSSHLARSANFVRWAVARRHASGLTAPATRWTGPSGPLDQDRRWADARRLLHDDAYPAADRVAGLLVLLYAQKLNAITALTTQHVQREDGRTLLRLGSRPIILPAPLDDLLATLADGRRRPGSSLLEVPSPWLFPGRHPGTALTPDALGLRLHALRISPRQGRSTALITLAAEVPAAILAKTLGIHVQVAIQWQKISAGDWAAYAADISHKNAFRQFQYPTVPLEAVRRALPDAVQAGDRWHLWHSLGEAVLKEVAAHSSCWAAAGPPLNEGRQAQTTAERWRQVHDLTDRGTGLLECSRRLGLSLNTVKRYARAAEPERMIRAPRYRATLVDPYREHLRARRAEDPAVPVHQLLAEIREQGYPGSMNLLYRYITQGRVEADRPHLSPRRVTRMLLTRPEALSGSQQALLGKLTAACPEMTSLASLVRDFAALLKPDPANEAKLKDWAETARAADLPSVHAFTRGLDLDTQAVTAAVTLPFHNGRTEGVNNKTKMIKRQMYGRASFTLLRHRILLG